MVTGEDFPKRSTRVGRSIFFMTISKKIRVQYLPADVATIYEPHSIFYNNRHDTRLLQIYLVFFVKQVVHSVRRPKQYSWTTHLGDSVT